MGSNFLPPRLQLSHLRGCCPMLEAIIRNASTLVYLFLFCVTFTGIGLLIWKRMRLSASNGETLFFSFGIGMAVTGYAVFALAAVQLLYPAVLFSLLVLLLALATAGWYNSGLFTMQQVNLPKGIVERLAAGILLIVLGAALLLALTPETARDALLYHLAIPKLYLKHHGFYFVPGNVFANYPFHTELLYLLALFINGDILAKLINFTMLPVILLGIYQFASRKMKNNSFPFLSMLIFAMIPSVFVDTHMAYNDLSTTLYSLCGFFAFLTWNERKEQGWLILFAFFTGMVLANKYTTLIIPFPGCLGVLWSHRSSEKGRDAMRDLAIYVSITLICGAPFYLKNWLLTGNPFYPFLYGFFGGRGWDPEQARLYDGMVLYMGMGRRIIDYLLLPWNLSIHARIHSIIFDGVIGPLFLIVLPFLVFIRKKDTSTKVILVFSLIFFLFWASASQQIRYLFPIFPLLACLAGLVISHYRGNRGMSLILGTTVCVASCSTPTRWLWISPGRNRWP